MTFVYYVFNIPGTKIRIKVFCCAIRKGWKSKEKYVMLRTNNNEKPETSKGMIPIHKR